MNFKLSVLVALVVCTLMVLAAQPPTTGQGQENNQAAQPPTTGQGQENNQAAPDDKEIGALIAGCMVQCAYSLSSNPQSCINNCMKEKNLATGAAQG